jgi:hypothetical protein
MGEVSDSNLANYVSLQNGAEGRGYSVV